MTYPEPDTSRSATVELASQDINEALKTLSVADGLAVLGVWAGRIIDACPAHLRAECSAIVTRGIEAGRNR